MVAEITRSPELDYIFQFFDRGFSDLGIVAEGRSFNPHITVARARRWQKETISFSFKPFCPLPSAFCLLPYPSGSG